MMKRPVVTFFIEPVSFSAQQKERLQKFSTDPGFILALENIASTQRALLENVSVTNPNEMGPRLQAIKKTAAELDRLIFEPDIWSLLGGAELFKGDYLERLHADLNTLARTASEVHSKREWRGKTKRDDLRLDMVGMVRDVLHAYKVKPEICRSNAWAVAVDTILRITGDALGDPLHPIRSFIRRKGLSSDNL
jgi:hypothetical protein